MNQKWALHEMMTATCMMHHQSMMKVPPPGTVGINALTISTRNMIRSAAWSKALLCASRGCESEERSVADPASVCTGCDVRYSYNGCHQAELLHLHYAVDTPNIPSHDHVQEKYTKHVPIQSFRTCHPKCIELFSARAKH